MYYSVTSNVQFRHICFYHHGSTGRIDVRYRTGKLSPREFKSALERIQAIETDEDVEALFNDFKPKLLIYANTTYSQSSD